MSPDTNRIDPTRRFLIGDDAYDIEWQIYEHGLSRTHIGVVASRVGKFGRIYFPIWISADARQAYGSDFEKTPEQIAYAPGVSLLTVATKRALQTRLQFADFDWEHFSGRQSDLPSGSLSGLVVSSDTTLEARTAQPSKAGPVLQQLRTDLARFAFAGVLPTVRGLYLSGPLGFAALAGGLRVLAVRGELRLDDERMVRERDWIKIEGSLLHAESDEPRFIGDFLRTPLPRPTGSFAFVMMPFTDEYFRLLGDQRDPSSIRSLIKRLTGRHCLTLDDDKLPGRIEDKLASHIEGMAFGIAEITTLNVNVFYELGLAHALGKPVVLLVDESRRVSGATGEDGKLFQSLLSKTFDVSHRHIVRYNGPASLEAQLTEALQAVVKVLA